MAYPTSYQQRPLTPIEQMLQLYSMQNQSGMGQYQAMGTGGGGGAAAQQQPPQQQQQPQQTMGTIVGNVLPQTAPQPLPLQQRPGLLRRQARQQGRQERRADRRQARQANRGMLPQPVTAQQQAQTQQQQSQAASEMSRPNKAALIMGALSDVFGGRDPVQGTAAMQQQMVAMQQYEQQQAEMATKKAQWQELIIDPKISADDKKLLEYLGWQNVDNFLMTKYELEHAKKKRSDYEADILATLDAGQPLSDAQIEIENFLAKTDEWESEMNRQARRRARSASGGTEAQGQGVPQGFKGTGAQWQEVKTANPDSSDQELITWLIKTMAIDHGNFYC